MEGQGSGGRRGGGRGEAGVEPNYPVKDYYVGGEGPVSDYSVNIEQGVSLDPPSAAFFLVNDGYGYTILVVAAP